MNSDSLASFRAAMPSEMQGEPEEPRQYVVLVSGDREWSDRFAVERRLGEAQRESPVDFWDFIVVHGACRGADRIAGEVAEKAGYGVRAHPAEWDKHGKAAGPIRNREMLKEKPDLVLAFHADISKSKGTLDMIRAANKAGIPVRLFAR